LFVRLRLCSKRCVICFASSFAGYISRWILFFTHVVNHKMRICGRDSEHRYHTVRKKCLVCAEMLTESHLNLSYGTANRTRRPASADRTARRHVLPMGSVPLRADIKLPPANILMQLRTRRQSTALYNFAADRFYIMKLCSRLLVLYCRNCPKDLTNLAI